MTEVSIASIQKSLYQIGNEDLYAHTRKLPTDLTDSITQVWLSTEPTGEREGHRYYNMYIMIKVNEDTVELDHLNISQAIVVAHRLVIAAAVVLKKQAVSNGS